MRHSSRRAGGCNARGGSGEGGCISAPRDLCGSHGRFMASATCVKLGSGTVTVEITGLWQRLLEKREPLAQNLGRAEQGGMRVRGCGGGSTPDVVCWYQHRRVLVTGLPPLPATNSISQEEGQAALPRAPPACLGPVP